MKCINELFYFWINTYNFIKTWAITNNFHSSLNKRRRGQVGKPVALAAEGRRFESTV